jgi:hypothetical protein
MTRLRAKQKRSAMYLETSDRRSLFLTALRGKLLLHEEAARKDPAVRVSLSSDSLVKQPGNREVPTLRRTEGPSKPAHPNNRRIPFHYSSEELQGRDITP